MKTAIYLRVLVEEIVFLNPANETEVEIMVQVIRVLHQLDLTRSSLPFIIAF